jgi:hypothetical protein
VGAFVNSPTVGVVVAQILTTLFAAVGLWWRNRQKQRDRALSHELMLKQISDEIGVIAAWINAYRLVAPHEAHDGEYSTARCDLERAYARLAQVRALQLSAEEAPAQPRAVSTEPAVPPAVKEAPAQPRAVPTEPAVPPAAKEAPAQPIPVPTMPVIRATEEHHPGFPHPLLDGIPRTIGWQWQSEAKGGPVFAIIVRGAMGVPTVQERFPLTEDGWRNAWHALAESDPTAARKVAASLAARPAEPRRLGRRRPRLAPPPSPPPKVVVKPHWAMAIWAVVFTWPSGIVAIIYASRVAHSLKIGDEAAARKYSSQVKIWFWISLTLFVILFVLVLATSSAGGGTG